MKKQRHIELFEMQYRFLYRQNITYCKKYRRKNWGKTEKEKKLKMKQVDRMTAFVEIYKDINIKKKEHTCEIEKEKEGILRKRLKDEFPSFIKELIIYQHNHYNEMT